MTFDWTKKSLGDSGMVPRKCLICGEDMTILGWEVYGDEIYCRKCKNRFRKPLCENTKNPVT